VNDLAMRGARPLYIAASFILEEGFPIIDLKKVVASMKKACEQAGVKVIAADTKIVNKGAADQIFITTTGIGSIDSSGNVPSAQKARTGDCVLISGDIGRHGIAIMSSREGLEVETEILSDSAPLARIVESILAEQREIHCLRDITRGGLASVLNELAELSNVGIELDEECIPIHPQVKAVCEILGLDPLYVACEGRMVVIVPENYVPSLLSSMREFADANQSCVVGRVVTEHPGRVVMKTHVGGTRIIDRLSGEQLPRIC
jgi:hydrogenase expression/formation protein HypE